MLRAILAGALLVLLVSGVALAVAPPTIWFYDDFESYGVGTRLRQCTTNWQDGFDGAGPENLIQNMPGCAYNGTQYVRLKGSSGTGAMSRAQTKYSWASISAGNVQILHFRLRRAWPDEATDPYDHANIFLIDANNNPICGWAGGTHRMKSKLTFTGTEGVSYMFDPNDWTYHDFDCYYYPDTGLVEFYVDGNLNWSTYTTPGLAVNKVYVRDYVKYALCPNDTLYLDDLAVGTTAKPTVTFPVGGVFVNTKTPTVTWTNANTGMTGYQVRVCSADDPSGPIVYDSGPISGSATSHQTGELPEGQQLWVFVNEQYGNMWTGFSVKGNGGFYVTTTPPTAPVVTSPNGVVVGAKPSVVFTADLHNKIQAKITTTPDGSGTPVWDSGEIQTMCNGASCSVLLTPGTQYYAFARVGNAAGWSDWSTASAFKVSREGEGTDIRHFDETWQVGNTTQNILQRNAPAPDDGFAVEVLPMEWRYVEMYLTNKCTGGNTVWDIYDWQPIIKSETMRLHRVVNLSLDQGVTLVLAHRILWEAGDYVARNQLQKSNIYIADDYGTGKCLAAFRVFLEQAGICTDSLTWTTAPITPSNDWRIIRITGRNQVVGDPRTAVWKLYINESPTPVVTATGSVDQSLVDSPEWMTDGIVIGQGCYGLATQVQFDWTAVNTAGDYAPGEWTPLGGTYASISEAKAGGETKPCVITGNAVITAVRKDITGSQLGFWVQDVNTKDHSGLYIPSGDPTNVMVGAVVTGISGIIGRSEGIGAVLSNPSFTVTTDIAEAKPLGMTQKALVGGSCVDEAGWGTDNVGMFVRIWGEVTSIMMTPEGEMVIYVDDGSGLVDGRTQYGDPLAKGIRIVATEFPFDIGVGKYYQIDGISAYETWTETQDENEVTKTVRTILCPVFTEIPKPE
ncbi:MAG: hypothetical protein QHI38_11980 [Armatimonadota bacterium]|nr:hypothetical protein [Armatimonadota bacterium]